MITSSTYGLLCFLVVVGAIALTLGNLGQNRRLVRISGIIGIVIGAILINGATRPSKGARAFADNIPAVVADNGILRSADGVIVSKLSGTTVGGEPVVFPKTNDAAMVYEMLSAKVTK